MTWPTTSPANHARTHSGLSRTPVRWARALPDPYADNATALVVRVA
ncbi:hypothetical protein ABZZ04_23740 [Streptomyces sp. NPDC006435]